MKNGLKCLEIASFQVINAKKFRGPTAAKYAECWGMGMGMATQLRLNSC